MYTAEYNKVAETVRVPQAGEQLVLAEDKVHLIPWSLVLPVTEAFRVIGVPPASTTWKAPATLTTTGE